MICVDTNGVLNVIMMKNVQWPCVVMVSDGRREHRYYRLRNRDMKQNRALHGYLYINNFGSVLLILSLRSKCF